MKREIGLLLAGVISFDLGVVPLSVPAASASETHNVEDMHFLKLSSLSKSSDYLKLDGHNAMAVDSCKGKSGTLVSYKGSDYCQIPKAGTKTK